MKQIIFLMASMFLLMSCVQDTTTAKVQYVIDGDTFVTTNSEIVRLAAVDAPELEQTYGLQSKQFLQNRLLHRKVTLFRLGKDVYNRQLCYVYTDDGQLINKQLVDSGYAWSYHNYTVYKEYEDQARIQCLGLWKYGAINPGIYRKIYSQLKE